MHRRDWLLGTLALLGASQVQPLNFGWLPDENLCRHSKLSQFDRRIRGVGQGQVVRLWKALEYVQHKPFENYVQTRGTCVGQACALAATILDSIQIFTKREGMFRGHYAAEPIYAGAKVEIARQHMRSSDFRRSRRHEGTSCDYAMQWMQQYGVCHRARYDGVDLTVNDCNLAVAWSRQPEGVPTSVEYACKQHPVFTVAKIDGGWEQACDAISQGYPIIVGSRQGFANETDSEGVLLPQGVWWHALCLCGIDTKSSRPVGCFANSWTKNWLSGPEYKYPAPPSGFWSDAEPIDYMLREGDAYAISNLRGYPRRFTDYVLF